MEGGKKLLVHDQRSLGKCRVGGPQSHEGLGVGKKIGRWFVRIRGGTNEWFMVCMGNEMHGRFVVAHGKENG